MNNIHNGHRERLRKKIQQGSLDILSEHEVLEFLLSYIIPRGDTNPIAHNLIREFGSLAGVFEADEHDIKQVAGMGDKSALFLNVIPEILKAYQKSKLKKKTFIKTPRDLFNYFGNTIKFLPNEEFYVVCLDSKSQVINANLVAKGSHNKVEFNIKDITKIALKTNAAGLILVHNHPTASSDPSMEDILLTKRVFLNLLLNNFCLLDHVIISKQDYYSFSGNSILNNFEKEFESFINISALAESKPEYNA